MGRESLGHILLPGMPKGGCGEGAPPQHHCWTPHESKASLPLLAPMPSLVLSGSAQFYSRFPVSRLVPSGPQRSHCPGNRTQTLGRGTGAGRAWRGKHRWGQRGFVVLYFIFAVL